MKSQEEYRFVVAAEDAEDQAAAGQGAQALADALREADGVLEAGRQKADQDTMDLGVIVTAIATSGATLAIAQGIAAWLRARRGVTLKIEREGKAGSIKAAVQGIDPETAERIVEATLRG
jgi:Effector Associated Constant Component 1